MRMEQLFIAGVLLSFTLVQANATDDAFVLHNGTPVKLRLSRNLSSADAKIGETVDFEVLEEVKIGDVIVIPRGGTALATVTQAQKKRRMARGGKLDINIDYVRLVNGDKAALRAVKETSGGGHTGAMTGGIVATSIVFFPAAPFFLFMHGKDTTIPKGTEITAYVNGEIKLDPTKFQTTLVAAGAQPLPTPAPRASGKRLTNADVLELKKAGFNDDLILAKVKGSEGDYQLETKDLIELKTASVSEAIIRAMIETNKR
jgi:hypothetical protein